MNRNLIEAAARTLFCAAIIVILPTVGIAGSVQSPESGRYALATVEGSTWIVDLPETTFSINLQSSEVPATIPLSEISLLSLVSQPKVDVLAETKNLINQLGDGDYERRESAEKALEKLMSNAQTRELVDLARSHELLEIRYRADRLMKVSGTILSKPQQWEYDRAVTKDGQVFTGDAGQWELAGLHKGKEVRFRRSEIKTLMPYDRLPSQSGISSASPMGQIENRPGKLTFDTLLDFETGIGGRKLLRSANLTREFVDQGVRFSTGYPSEIPGAILISPYPFNFENKPPGGNSICVSRDNKSLLAGHEGVAVMEFCVPSLEGVPAVTSGIGLYSARIDYAMAIIMQCFNADGQIVAEVLANDEYCSWFGASSPEGFAAVRVLANPYGLKLNMAIDEDFAIDNLSLGKIATSIPMRTDDSDLLRTTSGDLFRGMDSMFSGEAISIVEVSTNIKVTVPWNEVDWWAGKYGGPIEPDIESEDWFAMLDDRSVLKIRVRGERIEAANESGMVIPRELIAAIWSGRERARWPQPADFEAGENVLVFPAVRLAMDDLALLSRGIAWDGEKAKKLFQPVFQIADNEPATETLEEKMAKAARGAVPDYMTLPWKLDEGDWNLPTAWFKQPQPKPAGSGSISLRSGEVFSIGPECSFEVIRINEFEIVIQGFDGVEQILSIKDVWRIDWPEKNPG